MKFYIKCSYMEGYWSEGYGNNAKDIADAQELNDSFYCVETISNLSNLVLIPSNSNHHNSEIKRCLSG